MEADPVHHPSGALHRVSAPDVQRLHDGVQQSLYRLTQRGTSCRFVALLHTAVLAMGQRR